MKKALSLDPLDAHNYYGIGFIYLSLDDHAKAEQWENQALALQPDLINAHDTLCQIYLAQGKYQQAIQRSQKILSIEANEFTGLIAAGDAELFSGNYVRSKQYYEKAMAIYANRGDLLTRMGYILLKTGQPDEAKKMFSQSLKLAQEALEQGNEFWVIPYFIACINAIQGNKTKAYLWLQKAIDSGWRNFRLGSRDPLLENLREDEQFKQMTAQVKALVDEMRKKAEENNY
jgi:tetratricopeptide (TPR) repeat protein